jgi:hypothetical protein
MKERGRKNQENISHRGNNKDLMRKYQIAMDEVHKVPVSYYTMDGKLKGIKFPNEETLTVSYQY